MIYLLDQKNHHLYGDLLMKIHKLRYEHFVSKRGWQELDSLFELEIDQYDNHNASYIVIEDAGQVIASIRVIPSEFATFIGDHHISRIYAQYQPFPWGPQTWEMSRLLVSQPHWHYNGIPATSLLMMEMYNYLLKAGATKLIGLSDSELLSRLPQEWTHFEFGSRARFKQKDISDGESALVFIPLSSQAIKVTMDKYHHAQLLLGNGQDHLTPCPRKLTPAKIHAINQWLLKTNDQFLTSNILNLVEDCETNPDSLQKLEQYIIHFGN